MDSRYRFPALLAMWVLVAACPRPASAEPIPGWSPEVGAFLDGLVREHAPSPGAEAPVVAFDCDNTLIDGDISFASMVFQAEAGRYRFLGGPGGPLDADTSRACRPPAAGAKPDTTARAVCVDGVFQGYQKRWQTGNRIEACGYLAGLLEGMTPLEARNLGRDALAHALAHPRCERIFQPVGGRPFHEEQGIRLRPAMQALIDRLKAAGFEIFVVSASAKPLVEAAAERYGIAADHVLGVRTQVRDGRLTGEVLPPVTWRQGKVDGLRQVARRRPVLAFGDSWTDFEMLTDAEHAVLIDLGKEDLRKALGERGVRFQPRFPGEAPPVPCAP